jgi:hypothetical protein
MTSRTTGEQQSVSNGSAVRVGVTVVCTETIMAYIDKYRWDVATLVTSTILDASGRWA